MDLHELEHKTANELREMAKQFEDVEGVSALKKNQLIDLLCERLGIDRHAHVPEGIGRHKLKLHIRKLKVKRAEILRAGDGAALKEIRREIKTNKRRLRRQITRALRRAEPQAPAAG